MLKVKGFTLVELAIGMLIMSFLVGFLILPLSMQRESADIQQTQTALEQMKEAIIGYVLVTGHLPCPATISSNGQEKVTGSDCDTQHGFVPARTLNILGPIDVDSGLLLDTWGNHYRYSVFDTHREITKDPTLFSLKICEDNSSPCTNTKIVADNVPVVIFSMGKNGSQTASTLEGKNLDGDNDFVQAPYNNNSSSANRFDDVVVWISPYVLYNRMVQAGVYPP